MQIFGILAFILGPIMRVIYNLVNSYGLTIILFTLLIRVVSFPLAIHQQKSTAKMSVFQPMITEIQKKYKNDQAKQQEELQRLQTEYGYSPTAGCLPMALNMLIMFGVIYTVYYPVQYIMSVSKDVLTQAAETLGMAYNFQFEANLVGMVKTGAADAVQNLFTATQWTNIQNFNVTFLGINMCEVPQFSLENLFTPIMIFPALALITMVISNIISMSSATTGQEMSTSMKMMPWIMSVMFATFCFSVPAAFSLYYTVSNILMLGQNLITRKMYNPAKMKEQYTAELAAKKAEKKKKKQVVVLDKTGKEIVKSVTDDEMKKLRLARARALDEEKYADERTTRLDGLSIDAPIETETIPVVEAADAAQEPAEDAAKKTEKKEN